MRRARAKFASAANRAALVEGLLCLEVRDLWPELIAAFQFKRLDVERMRSYIERTTGATTTYEGYDNGEPCFAVTGYLERLVALMDAGLFKTTRPYVGHYIWESFQKMQSEPMYIKKSYKSAVQFAVCGCYSVRVRPKLPHCR